MPPEELPTLDGAAPTDLAQRRLDATAAVCADHGLEDPEAIEAVALAHQLVCDNHAPFIVDRTLDMLDHIKADVEAHPGTVVVFLGRDGDAIGLAARELDPEFYEQHCTHVTLSRCLAESAVQDLEKNANKTFPELKEEEFRNARSEVNPEHVDGARARLTEYLELRGVPVGEPGARIILVDTSFKGTVQNLLTATYPGADFHGKYLFYDQSSTDPNAGQKTAFALHRDPEGTITDPRAEANQPGGTGANPLEIFVEKDPVLAIEQILRGSLSKAVHVENGVPDQHPESPPLEEINPLEVAEKYLDEPVRLAVMDINQLAVADFAATVAVARREGGPWRADLDAKAKEFVNKLGAWSRREPLTEPALAEFLGSFVRREDKRLVAQLHSLIEDRGLDSTAVWRDYQQCGTLAAQSAFVEEKRNDTTASGGEASYG
ncbi:hypothetical protein ACIA8C_21605 [Nocardia sp. NPDC051321]|uniref:hypothetical protein n=1 Tax=Nocardia sp. NPDC051321 TaxID=3364323 RepID=UPI00379622C5